MKAEEADGRAKAKLEAENGWDLKLSGGGRRELGQSNLGPDISQTGAFGEVSLTYNFGRHSANQHLDRSAVALADWKRSQFNDVTQEAGTLRKEIEETVGFLQKELGTLVDHDAEIDKSVKTLQGVDTSSALAFKNQLLADQIVLRVDIGDMQYRLSLLQSYLRDNFSEN
jgi:hypothetical protein